MTKKLLEPLRRRPLGDHDRGVEVPQAVHVVFRSGFPIPPQSYHTDPFLNRLKLLEDGSHRQHVTVFAGKYEVEGVRGTGLHPAVQIIHEIVTDLDGPITALGFTGANLSLTVCPLADIYRASLKTRIRLY